MDLDAREELDKVRVRLNRIQDELDQALGLVERQTNLIERLLFEISSTLERHHGEILQELRSERPTKPRE